MKIPDKLKIGGHYFDICVVPPDNGFERSGQKNGWKTKILLHGDMVQSKRESVLIHEVIHEIAWQANIDLNEIETSVIAEGLYQVLVDNKLLREGE